MGQQRYAIRKVLLIPLAVDVALLLVLLLISLVQGGTAAERAVLAIMLVAAVLVVLEAGVRRVTVGDAGIRFRKLLRVKDVDWKGVTHVGVLVVRTKVYLLLTTVRGFFIFSNAYDHFPLLVEAIVSRVEAEKVEQDVRSQTEHAGAGWGNVVSASVAALVMAAIIFVKLFPF
jgi:hypothetical protein